MSETPRERQVRETLEAWEHDRAIHRTIDLIEGERMAEAARECAATGCTYLVGSNYCVNCGKAYPL